MSIDIDMKVTQVVATDRNGVMASSMHNRLLWHCPSDLKRFKALTLKKMIIMGRKTFESIGKPLPNRFNIILSRSRPIESGPNWIILNDIYQALNFTHRDKYIIGGLQIYEQFMPWTTDINLTQIDVEVEGDMRYEVPKEFTKITTILHAEAEKDPGYQIVKTYQRCLV